MYGKASGWEHGGSYRSYEPVNIPRWQRVTQMTDNRLRLLRLHEKVDKRPRGFSARRIDREAICQELIDFLGRNADQARSSVDRNYARISDLRAAVIEHIRTDDPYFTAIYAEMDVEVPKRIV